MLHQLEPGKHTREVNAKHWRAVLHEYLPREYVFPIALAIFVAIVVWFGRSIHDFFIPSSSTVLIPSFVGQAVSDATAEATRFNLRSQVVARQMSDQYPKDVVMGQEPAPGSVVKPGREVSLVVSNGVTLYAMPDLRFQSMREAGLDLSHSHLQLNKVTYVRSDEVPANHIVSQDPPPLSTVREGSQVDLVVSKGGVSQIRVPSFVGETIDEVRDEMDRQGIHVGQIVWTPLGRSAPPHGTVVRQ
ncbi:MAG: PASTA domain-containing protein, partial [Candidatus Eremiobacteraeota bacterium]|nr:PASTA domain-containing protein [Candidatus Eremiobacteraeota bacterium]